MSKGRHHQFIQFLQHELAVPPDAIAVALKQADAEVSPLHMILWQYGLVSIEQLGRIFDWLSEQPYSVS